MGDFTGFYTKDQSSPPVGGFSIAPDDVVELPTWTRALMVATAGNVRVTGFDNIVYTLPALQVGVMYPCRAKRVHATGTTATGIIGLY